MSGNIRPYQDELKRAEQKLKTLLAGGTAGVSEVAVARRTWEIMSEDLQSSPGSVLVYDRVAAGRASTGLPPSGPRLWHQGMSERAENELYPQKASVEIGVAYEEKRREYAQFADSLKRFYSVREEAFRDPERGRSYLARTNKNTPEIVDAICKEFLRWFDSYPSDREFVRRGYYLHWSAKAGMGQFFKERPDMAALLRLAQTLPPDVEISEVPIDRPAYVHIVELGVGLIPVAGNIVAAYEAYAGVDLFGYRLTPVERGILAATVLLPLAGRLVKGGRALYSEARPVSLYGQDAATWSRTIRATSGASGLPLKGLRKAEAALRVEGRVDAATAEQFTKGLPDLVRGTSVSTTVERAVADLFRDLASKYEIMKGLDEFAMRRILAKGPDVNHLKGQLLEELIESRIVPWLRDRAGSFALGIKTEGKQLEFIPGHLIRGDDGRQITDGILAVRDQGVLDIVAVFEAKSGKDAARGLSLEKGTISSLSAKDRAQLRAYAKDNWLEQRLAARDAGKPLKKTIEDVEREVAASEVGGQVRKDLERLYENEDGTLAEIRIGSDSIKVRFTPTRTKFFGVLPKDVNSALIASELKDLRATFEIIGVDVTQRELIDMANRMVPAARDMAAKAP